jgi:HlyD family secretion protein
MKKKIIWIILLAILIASCIYYFFFYGKKENVTWKTALVEKGNITLNVTATGSLNALTMVQVGTQVNGTVAKLFADFNTKVRAGQIIALLDTTFLAAAKEEATAMADRAESLFKESQIEYERSKKLYEQSAISKAEYDIAFTNFQTSQSSLRSAKAQLSRAIINMQYATIKAPISGIVVSRNVDVGQTVISSFNSPVLFTIANDLMKMELIANVDEADIGQVKVGQEVVFTVDAYPNEEFNGKIKQIRLQPLIIQNVVNYAVVIDVVNPELKLMPGLTANINIKTKEDTAVQKIPVTGINFKMPEDLLKTLPDSSKIILPDKKNEPGSKLIWIKRSNIPVQVKVNVGISDGSYVAIKGNIHEGDEVITGILSEETKASQTKNPFMPKFPTRGPHR